MVGPDEIGFISWPDLDEADCLWLMEQALNRYDQLQARQRFPGDPDRVRALLDSVEKDRLGLSAFAPPTPRPQKPPTPRPTTKRRLFRRRNR